MFQLALAGGLFTVVPPLGHAEEQQGSRSMPLEEVVVTARRREESLQDIPVAVTSFSDERLYKQFAVDLRDFGPAVPNFQLEQVGLFQSAAAFSARGIGTTGIESFADPVVAVFVDGQYYPRNANALLDVFDLEAVEVLRGPQGTLYGQNAFAGAISVRTRRPSGERAARFEATAGNYDSRIIKGAVETPVVWDSLNAKLSVIHRDFDGYFDVENLSRFSNQELDALVGEPVSDNIGRSAQGETKTVGRFTLQWLPQDDMEVTLITTRERNRGDGSPGINGYFEPGGGPSVFGLLGFPGRDPFGDAHRGIAGDGSDPFEIGANHRDLNDQDLLNVVGEFVWNTDHGEWTTMIGIQEVDSFITTDTDGELVDLFSSERQENYESVQFETRFNTRPGQHSNLLTGLFVLRDKYDLHQRLLLGFGDSGDPAADPPRAAVPPYQFPVDVRSPMHSVGRNGQKRISVAPYVDYTYDLTPRLTLNLALRATWEEKTAFNTPNQVAVGPPAEFIDKGDFDRVEYATRCGTASESWFNLAPRAGLDFRPTENVLVFGFWQRAFKSGGLLNNSATCGPFLNDPFDEEQVDNFELGMKGNFFNYRLMLNVNAFYARYKDLQRTVIRFAPDTPTQQETFTSNAAGADIFGVELETQAALLDGLTWFANVGWLDAEYDNFCADLDGPGAIPVGGTPASSCGAAELLAPGLALIEQDNSDLELTRAPDWDLSTRLVYEWRLGSFGSLSVEGAYSYTSKLHTAVNNAVRTDRDSLRRIDASVTWTDATERYRVSAWGKNLNDDVERLSRTEVAPLFTFEFPTAPRTYGATFTASF
ncbi:MAG: TonB-dependent receptor [Pseudomonadota bacterium]